MPDDTEYFSESIEYVEDEIVEVVKNNSNDEGFSTTYLWVLEPEDLDDFSTEQVEKIWAEREVLCGSKEVAAEVLALVKIIRGEVLTYQGWQAYINSNEIKELDIPFLSEESEASYISSVEKNALTRLQVLELNDNELEISWANRPESFSTIEAACQALALLRTKMGVVNSCAWQGLLNHDEIEKLKDDLPSEKSVIAPNNSGDVVENRSATLNVIDTRRRQATIAVVREGQQEFRNQVLSNYYGICCISGSQITEVIEAAHISPYSGIHSNRLDNGLCLRVDIHRLFDKFLLSIDPETRKVKISQKIKTDPEYAHLDGKRMTRGKVMASDFF